MRRREWLAVALAVGGGIVLQIPRHDHARTEHGAAGHVPAVMEGEIGTHRTVVLAVTGMT